MERYRHCCAYWKQAGYMYWLSQFIILLLYYMGVLPACKSVDHVPAWCLQKPKEGSGYRVTGAIDGGEPHSGDRNRVQALWKSSQCSEPLHHHSSPCTDLVNHLFTGHIKEALCCYRVSLPPVYLVPPPLLFFLLFISFSFSSLLIFFSPLQHQKQASSQS